MQVKIISDTHNQHDLCTDLECDILVHCGDFGTKGNHTEARTFLSWMVKQPAKYKVLVAGNHDRRLKTSPELQMLAKEYGIHFLQNEMIEINGRKLYGGDFVPWVRNGKYESSLSTRAGAWASMPMELDLLITHAPPRYILDRNKEGSPCGCDQLLEAVKIRDIKKHVFGHIHEDGGKDIKAFGTEFYNCACKDRNYLFVRNYTEIEI